MYNPLKPQTAVPDDGDDEADQPEVPRELQLRFWKLVAVINVGVLAAAVGLLFLVFEADVVLGLGFGLPGAVVLAYAAVDYRRAKASLESANPE